MDFDEYQRLAAETDVRSKQDDPQIPLLGLAGEVGSLVTEYKKKLRSTQGYGGFATEVTEDLGDLLWYAAALARTFGISLGDVAVANLAKTRAYWGRELAPPIQYDSNHPEDQRFPRSFPVTFKSVVAKDGLARVKIYAGDVAAGDPLDDNVYEEDHYRFHDALHFAHAAVLGWSPVARWLLKRKRKTDSAIDRIEDGGRAIALEEGLTAFVFSEARSRAFYKDAEAIDWDLLKTVRRMVAHLEVADQPPNAWRSAIFQGYAVWRSLREASGGIADVDLADRSIRFRPLKAPSSPA